MTIALAIEYIPRRMNELGFGDNYVFRFRHLVLQGGEILVIEADNQFFILLDEISDVSITSDIGYYDISETNINEQSYEHQGTITINNNSQQLTHLKFIQVIPNHLKK